MSKSNASEFDIVSLIFNSTPFSWSSVTALFVSLHTADPTDSALQTASECTYGSYARQEVPRNATNWTVSGNQASNKLTISFPECTSGSENVSHVGIGTLLSGAGTLVYSGALNATRSVSSGITLQFAANALVVSED